MEFVENLLNKFFAQKKKGAEETAVPQQATNPITPPEVSVQIPQVPVEQTQTTITPKQSENPILTPQQEPPLKEQTTGSIA